MSRLVGVLFPTVLLVCFGVSALAESPSSSSDPPPPWFGGRVELPQHGLAITFPDEWIAFDLSADIDVQVTVAYDRLGGMFVLPPTTTIAWLAAKAESFEALAFSPASPVCELDVMPVLDSMLNPLAQEQVDTFIRSAEGISGYEGISAVEVAAGPGVTMHWVQLGAGPNGEDIHHASYTLDIDGRAVDVTCEGISRPTDDWFSIVDSIEALP